MSDTVRGVGFDRKIRLAWLEAVAGWTASGMPDAEIRAKLDRLLEGEVTGKEARKKTKTVLLRTWLLPSERLRCLRDQGLALLSRTNDSERLALHWGMVCAGHPVVWETASIVGRLLRLQGEASLSQVRARIVETYGERSTVVRASQRILRSFSDWNVLEEMSERGIYRASVTHRLEDSEVVAWLIEASLLSSDQETRVLPTLLASPSLFPFDISLSGREFSDSNSRIALYSQGKNEELVSLQPSR
ncbi:MAG: hypothetical protein ACR2JR_09985 [Rubrobacteraceae bacterium]